MSNTEQLKDGRGYLTTEGFKEAMKARYAFPGMYPLAFLTSDGETMSWDYAEQNQERIIEAIQEKSTCGWRVVDCFINWESTLYCCGTGKQIESAYTPVDGEEAGNE